MPTAVLLSPVAAARTRFAWSPLVELLGAVRRLRDPDRTRRHVPWLAEAAGRLSAGDLALVTAAVPAAATPGFLLPGGGSGSVYGDLAEVQRAVPETVLAQYGRLYPDGLPAALAPLRDDPVTALQDLVAAMARTWQVLVEPALPAVEACVATELRVRERGIAHEGLAATLDGLHDALSWRGDALVIGGGDATEVVVGAAGLRLVPSVLVEKVELVEDAAPVSVLYPAHGRRSVWERPYGDLPDSAAEVLSSLLGSQRARIVAELVWPRGTTALARRLGLSPSVVSRHLSVLEAAGLVRRSREGHRTVCSLTAAGAELLAPPRTADVLS